MKTLLQFWAPVIGGALLALPGRAQTQVGALLVDKAAVVPAIATPGQGTILDLQQYTDAHGNTYQAGTFQGTIHVGSYTFTSAGNAGSSNDYELFVAKRTATGVYQWAVAGGGLGEQRVKALAVDAAGNVFIAGSFASATMTLGAATLTNTAVPTTTSNDVFVAKLDAAGGWQWAASAGGSARVGGANDEAASIAVDVLGNVYVAGIFTSRTAFFGSTISLLSADLTNGGRETAYVAKLSPAGVWQWARRSETVGMGVATVVTDAAAAVYLAAQYSGMAGFGPFQGAPLPPARYAGGGTAIVKLDGSGAWQWMTTSRSSRYETGINCFGLCIGQQGELYTAGTFNGDTATFGATRLVNTGAFLPPLHANVPSYRHTQDAYLARLDTRTGAWRWAVQSQGAGDEILGLPLTTEPGVLYVGGTFSEATGTTSPPPLPGSTFGTATLYSAGGFDALIARLDTAGRWQWVARAGGPDNEEIAPQSIDSQGRLLLSGSFTGSSLQLGGKVLAAAPMAFYQPITLFGARLDSAALLAAPAAQAAVHFSVYPNPSHDRVTIAGVAAGQPVQVVDVLGRLVATGIGPAQGALQLTLPAGLPAGVYVVRAGHQARRLLVE